MGKAEMEVELVGFIDKINGYEAVEVGTGKRLHVNPFVGALWEYKKGVENIRGVYKFSGSWYGKTELSNMFLPSKEL